MRILLLALSLTAAPAVAQTVDHDSTTGSRFSLGTHAALAVADDGAPTGLVGLTGAYEFAAGTAATLSVTGGDLGPGRAVSLSLGPGLTHARALDARSDAVAAVGVRFTGSQTLGGSVPHRGAQAFGVVGVDRTFKLAGTVEVVPTLGAYAAVGKWVEEENADGETLGGPFASAGLLAGARVQFSAFGRTWAVPLVVPVEVFGRGQNAIPAYAESFGSRVDLADHLPALRQHLGASMSRR